jgi:hypothetical protein
MCYQAENHVITTNIESNFHEILFETTNIDLKGDKILNEIGKTLSLWKGHHARAFPSELKNKGIPV